MSDINKLVGLLGATKVMLKSDDNSLQADTIRGAFAIAVRVRDQMKEEK